MVSTTVGDYIGIPGVVLFTLCANYSTVCVSHTDIVLWLRLNFSSSILGSSPAQDLLFYLLGIFLKSAVVNRMYLTYCFCPTSKFNFSRSILGSSPEQDLLFYLLGIFPKSAVVNNMYLTYCFCTTTKLNSCSILGSSPEQNLFFYLPGNFPWPCVVIWLDQILEYQVLFFHAAYLIQALNRTYFFTCLVIFLGPAW